MTVDERREWPRHPRRVQVRFVAEGEQRFTSGMTNNLSPRGVFITAPKVFSRGTRLRLELDPGSRAVVIEGVVAHAHRVPTELRALGTSGMGIRFLPPEEILKPLLPAEMMTGMDLGEDEQDAEDAENAASSSVVFEVSFRAPSDFLRCFHRDLVNGGIFVRTERPRPMHSLIELEFQVPGREEPIGVRGRVVQVIEPRTGESPPRGGMGVELLELDDLLDELRPLVERLGG